MGFYRLIYRIGRMIFRDFLFKIPKKYLVVIIVFLSMFILKSNVFAVSTSSAVTEHTTIPYTNVREWYSELSLINKTSYSFTYDSSLELFNSNNSTFYVLFDMYRGASIANDFYWCPFGFYSPVENGSLVRNFLNFGYVDGDSSNCYYYINGSQLTGSTWPGENNNVFTAFKGERGFGYASYSGNGSRSWTPSVQQCDFLSSNSSNISFNIGQSLSTDRFSHFDIHYFYTRDENDTKYTHYYYPCQATLSNGNTYYGFYDTYSGNFDYFPNITPVVGSQLTGDNIPEDNTNNFRPPSILNMDTDIQTWSFENLVISAGDLESHNNNLANKFYLQQIYNDKSSTLNLSPYMSVENNYITFNVPRSVLLQNSAIVSGYSVRFVLNFDEAYDEVFGSIYYTRTDYDLGTYTFNLTQTEQDIINEDKTQQSLSDITSAQQDTTNAVNNMNNSINNLNNNITNDNVSSSVISQPNVPNDTSGVESGVNNIFTTIMNSFTNFNSDQDIVFPIPFTSQNITINGNYTRNMLTSVHADWIINIVTIFWWYLISVYIVKDVLKMVDKIQEGKIDNVESSNIKGDML